MGQVHACLPNKLIDATPETSAPKLWQNSEHQPTVQSQQAYQASSPSLPMRPHRNLGAIQQLLLEYEHFSESSPTDPTLYSNAGPFSANPWQKSTQASSPAQQAYCPQVTCEVPKVPQLWSDPQRGLSGHVPSCAPDLSLVEQQSLRCYSGLLWYCRDGSMLMVCAQGHL